jgi:hypothetical protein
MGGFRDWASFFGSFMVGGGGAIDIRVIIVLTIHLWPFMCGSALRGSLLVCLLQCSRAVCHMGFFLALHGGVRLDLGKVSKFLFVVFVHNAVGAKPCSKKRQARAQRQL